MAHILKWVSFSRCWPACAWPWFLRIALSANIGMHVCVCVCICACVSTPKAINNKCHDIDHMIGQISSMAFIWQL